MRTRSSGVLSGVEFELGTTRLRGGGVMLKVQHGWNGYKGVRRPLGRFQAIVMLFVLLYLSFIFDYCFFYSLSFGGFIFHWL